MVNKVPPFSCEYDVVGVKIWGGSSLTPDFAGKWFFVRL
jgi:hypothetical protein